MSARETGGPAFPMPSCPVGPTPEHGYYSPIQGMDLRDWLAGQAMQAYVTGWVMVGRTNDRKVDAAALAELSYQVADAMLAERSKR